MWQIIKNLRLKNHSQSKNGLLRTLPQAHRGWLAIAADWFFHKMLVHFSLSAIICMQQGAVIILTAEGVLEH